jgi:hypothetical protein
VHLHWNIVSKTLHNAMGEFGWLGVSVQILMLNRNECALEKTW